jgi:hypothetical protein
MGISLDSNALSAGKTFLNWVYGNSIYAYLPSIAYMELSYHHLKKHGHTRVLDGVIDGYGIEVIPFDVGLARGGNESAAEARPPGQCHRLRHRCVCRLPRHAPDHCNNKRFSWLKEVYTPEELMKKLG